MSFSAIFFSKALAALSIAFSLSASASSFPFPDQVFIKTPRLTFNSIFYFGLDSDGRIWIKPIEKNKETKGFAPGWQLFGTGLPQNKDIPDFDVPAKIISLHGDADEIMAVSDQHRFYTMRWLHNPKFPGSPKHWLDKLGWPIEKPFYWGSRIQGNRGWGIGRRNQIVGTFEDPAGKSFTGGGGLTTYYFLSRSGTEIFFSDSGLPSDHSHTVCGPRRSTFVAEAFDVAASTLFVINKTGEMFTRLYDFDTIGSDTMFFDYTYGHSNTVKSNIALPAEDWLQQAPILVTGQGRLSSQITIALTGKGNRGRELRVAGLGPDGNAGYYYKDIFTQPEGSAERWPITFWNFKPVAGLEIAPDRWLNDDLVRNGSMDPGAASMNSRFSGTIPYSGQGKIQVSIPDFHLSCSPVTLDVSHDGEKASFILHTVEEWFDGERDNPGFDGTPNHFQGTLEILPSERARIDHFSVGFRTYLKRFFLPLHLKDFAFSIEATQDYALIEQKAPIGPVPALQIALTRSGADHPSLGSARRSSLRRDGFMALAESPELLLNRDLSTLTPADAVLLSTKIEQNAQVLQTLNSLYQQPGKDDAAKPFYIKPVGYAALSSIFKLLGVVSKKSKTISRNLPGLLSQSGNLRETMTFSSLEDFNRARFRVQTRIRAYEFLREQLLGNGQDSHFVYHETVESAWLPHLFGFAWATGPSALPSGCRFSVNDAAMFDSEINKFFGRERMPPSLWVELSCMGGENSEPPLLVRIEPRQLLEDEFEYSFAGRAQGFSISAYVEKRDASQVATSANAALFGTSEQSLREEANGMLVFDGERYRLEMGRGVITWARAAGTQGPAEYPSTSSFGTNIGESLEH